MTTNFLSTGIMEKMLHYGVAYTNHKFMCVKIPKSASTWAMTYFKSLDWEDINFAFSDYFDLPALIFIREPKDRWIAGVSEFLERYHNNLYDEAKSSVEARNNIFDSIFDQGLSMDSHTSPQTYFIERLTNPVYFEVDQHLSEKVSDYLGTKLNTKIINSKSSNPTWRTLAVEYLSENELATKTLDLYLKTDYDLFKSIREQQYG